MILADTSIWIDHFRHTSARLAELYNRGELAIHLFVIGELACGNLAHRATTLADLGTIPAIPMASDAEAHHVVESHRLWGAGLSWVDVHLLAAVLAARAKLWSNDKSLHQAALRLGVAA